MCQGQDSSGEGRMKNMCNFLSCIGMKNGDILFLTEDYSEPDSHGDILTEFLIKDADDCKKFVRLEMQERGKMVCDGVEWPRWTYQHQSKWRNQMVKIFDLRQKQRSTGGALCMSASEASHTFGDEVGSALGGINCGPDDGYWGVCMQCRTVFTEYGNDLSREPCPLCNPYLPSCLDAMFEALKKKYQKK